MDFSGYDFRECSLSVVWLLRQRIQVHVSDYGGWFAGDDDIYIYIYIYAVFSSLSSGPGCAASCAVWTRRTVTQRDSGLSVEPLVSGSHVQCLLRRRHTGIGFFFGEEMTSMSFCIQRYAWFDSGYMYCVSLRSF